MSTLMTGLTSSVDKEQMSAVDVGQMSAVSTHHDSSSGPLPKHDPKAIRCLLVRQGRCLLLRQNRCALLRWDRYKIFGEAKGLSQQDMYPISATDINPISKADVCLVTPASVYPVPTEKSNPSRCSNLLQLQQMHNTFTPVFFFHFLWII